MGLPTMIAAVSIGMSAFDAVHQASSASDAAQAQMNANAKTAQAQVDEAARQQGLIDQQAQEDKSDRMAQATRELASARVAAFDRGAGAGMETRIENALSYTEGEDLSRIEQNRKNQDASLEASKTATVQKATTANSNLADESKATQEGAFLGFVGNAVQIGGSAYRTNTLLDLAKNKKS